MAYSPKTYDLQGNMDLAVMWEKANDYITELDDKNEDPVAYIPFKTKNEALATMHAMNRFRSAYRVQAVQDGNNHIKFDWLVIRVKEGINDQWLLKIEPRFADRRRKGGLTLVDKDGNALFNTLEVV